ncbi:cytochrome P450 [Plenodomus tracheiphilus IPT5]|uniref:Cytochrome P450 n=1 Tax=Plenodomus tracheiphilus IPT5 TaxID=1408161 RepID=A0A6A7BB99_9PLEO|nr:cytochrome P450 [Plenodomus tracheiphilus IPT5]
MVDWIQQSSTERLLITLLAAYFVYSIIQALYNIAFHPLATFPGPRLRAAFYFPNAYEVLTGEVPASWHGLHEQYGEVVRINPNTLSYINPDAWRDIYGHGNKMPLLKDLSFYHQDGVIGRPDIISANDADHAKIRRPLNYAFSEQALRIQEGIIYSYIRLMITKFHKHAVSKTPVDIMRWLNFATFDITGDLTFDESFGSLNNENFNVWTATLFKMVRAASALRILREYPIVGVPAMALLRFVPALIKARHAHVCFTREKVERRLKSETGRKDFLSYVLQNDDGTRVTVDDIERTCSTLIVAGSETSATLLSGAIYYLLKNPQWMIKLREEIDTAFQTDDQISFAAVSQLSILNAIINETFRMYPPVPTSLPRIVPPEGAIVCNNPLPPGTQLGIAQYAMYRSSTHFKNADTFAPERFLGAEVYANDKREVINPFSVGPRNCIGQSLAWAEIRTILVRLVWHFDMQLEDESVEWEKQKVFILWQKAPLMVKSVARTH